MKNYQYVKIEEYNSKMFISNVKNITIEGMGLVKLNSDTFNDAMEELKIIFENFEII